MWPLSSPPWKAIAEGKVTERNKALESAMAESASQAVYLSASAPDIVKHIAAGEWTASDVLEAYISRAALAQEKVNCLTEVLFMEARKQAQALDEYSRTTKKLKGPLHGVPVSFKDVYDIAGYDTTMGNTGDAHKPASADAEVVRLVREAGGIPFVKTNLPQALMFWECVNPTWGRTLNPYSSAHTCGGSSGGEGALLGMDGSALGWGNDIGGSLRIPANFCGIYSLKPGYGRIPVDGVRDHMPGFEAIRSVTGPLGRSVADLELACRVVFGQQSETFDPAPIAYRDVKISDKLRFGYYVNDGYAKSSPAVQRAVLETVDALRREGHECIEFPVPDMTKASQIFLALVLADGNQTLFSPIGHDPRQTELTTMSMGPDMPGWVRSVVAWLTKSVMGDTILADVLSVCKAESVSEFWAHVDQQKQYIRKFYSEVWDNYYFDGIIAPVVAIPPLPHKAVTYIASLACHSFLYNLIDHPVGTIPVTRVDPVKDKLTEEWTEYSVGGGHGSPVLEGMLYKGDKAIYNADKMAGLPIGVQVVGKKWEEEKVIAMMKVVDRALGRRSFGPGCWKP